MRRSIACIFVIAGALGTGACATTGATPRPFPTPAPPASAAHPSHVSTTNPRDLAYGITGTALNLRGTPYKNGGSDPSGFDCSGFVNYVFGHNGVTVPRTVTEQFRAGRQIDAQHLEPGDLVFFTTVSPGASHVGIAIGGDEFVHAPSSTGEVRVERLSGAYWATRFVGARRVL